MERLWITSKVLFKHLFNYLIHLVSLSQNWFNIYVVFKKTKKKIQKAENKNKNWVFFFEDL